MLCAVSLSTTELIPRSLTATLSLTGIRSLADVSNLVGPISHPVALPPARNTQRCTSMHFGENQLSRSLIGLSPLPTAHPLSFQPKWVRSSTRSYPRFNLAMGRSLRFGSRACDWIALFGLAFATASPHGLTSPHTTNSQAHSSKGTPSPVLGRLRRFVGTRFQVLFHSPPGVLFTFPSRYWSAIGHQGVFRLRGWSPQIRTGFLGPRATWDLAREFTPYVYGAITLCGGTFQSAST